jgi:hypothetical protein
MKWVVESTKRLDIFIFWSRPYSKHVQLSWCPDGSINPRNRYHYGKMGMEIEMGDYNYQENLSLDATPGSSCQASFAKDLSTMTVLGLVWGVVFGFPIPFAGEYRLDEAIEDYSQLSRFTAEATQMGCQRLIVSFREETMSEPSSVFYAKLLEALMYEPRFDQQIISEFKTWCWSEISNHESSLSKSLAQLEKYARVTPQDDCAPSSFDSKELVDEAPGTTLVLTRDHNVCVIPGCPTPMMLRSVEKSFELLGPVYVPGIMLGEAMTALQEKKAKLRQFELH